MYKSSILIAALVTGACASENPFALEKNIQKIEQDESTLLQAIAKEQKKLEREEDELFEESKPEEIAPAAVKQKEPAVVSPNETLDKVQVEKLKKVIPESVPKEAVPVAEETKRSVPPSVEKVPINAEVETVKKAETSKSEEPLTIRDVTEKSEAGTVSNPESAKAQPSVERKIEEVDAEIKKLEEKLETSKVESAADDEVSAQSNAEANGSAESNTIFEQELQEAIRSVQD